jgi:hypothetical protein
MKQIALALVVIVLCANTAHAQKKRMKRRYVQRPDAYAQLFSDWASGLQPEYSGIDRCATIGGSGMVFGTSISCNDCGTAGHYSCGAGASSCPRNFLYQTLVP